MHKFTIGFIGTGSIAKSVVKALSTQQTAPKILLSPRSEKISKKLEKQYPNVLRMQSNAEVVQNADIIVLSTTPEQLSSALKGIIFKEEQIIISLVATLTLEKIIQLVHPATKVCRATPLTTIEKKQGPIVIYPALNEAKKLFKDLGTVLDVNDEEQMNAFGCAAAVTSSFFKFQHQVAKWLTDQDISEENASLYMRSLFLALSNTSFKDSNTPLSTLSLKNETKGGLNEQMRSSLDENKVFELIYANLNKLAVTSL